MLNRYVIAGALADMRSGRRVLVLTRTQVEARAALELAATEVRDDERVYWANGRERIASDGVGEIRFAPRHTAPWLRWAGPDVIVDAHTGIVDKFARPA